MTDSIDTLAVELGERSYPILVGENLLQQADLLLPYIAGERVCIVTNETIAPLYLDKVKALLAGKSLVSCILPDGEQYKNLRTMEDIYTLLLKERCGRDVTLLALGGGVIGDMTGFAAATYQRGVQFVQLPTTLLAQVDSSVGGKTGVNHALGKNMIGAFYQPRAVLIDTQTLSTLPDREFIAGLAEVIKYGFIEDKEFLYWLDQHIDALRERDPAALRHAITSSCASKARVVASDEREAGLRAILNFGHTFAHAIETATEYRHWLHGEAVGFGMLMGLEFSQIAGYLSEAQVELGASLIRRAGLPLSPPEQLRSAGQMLELMAHDKKVAAGKLRLVLLRSPGEAIVTGDFDQQKLADYLQRRLGEAH